MLSPSTEQQINQISAGHEQSTANQIVVATVPDLQGYSIETYGYQLGRHWGIGQQDKNNGVLLLIAKSERKVRIEVGYGLEGELTDAISSSIIQNDITPHFKRGQFDAGTLKGVQSIVEAIGGTYKPPRSARKQREENKWWKYLLFFIFFFVWPMATGRRSFLFWLFAGSAMSSGSRRSGGGGLGGGGFGGGGFSGGGGSFGGGGASGGW